MKVKGGSLLNTWFSVTEGGREGEAARPFMSAQRGSGCSPGRLGWWSRSFTGERTIEGHQRGGSLILYVGTNRRNAAKALQNALQQDVGVQVSDQTVRNRLHEGQTSSGLICAFRPGSETQLALEENRPGSSAIQSSEQMRQGSQWGWDNK